MDLDSLLNEHRLDLAHKSFETYKAQCREQGEEPEYERFEDQPPHLQESGLRSVDDILNKVSFLGYRIETAETYEGSVVETFSNEEIERLSEREHERWMAERLENGWVPGSVKDTQRKITPCLIPYEELSEEEKDKDRRVVMNMIPLLRELGYVVC